MANTFKDVVSAYKREQDKILNGKSKDPEKELDNLLTKTLNSLNDIFNQMSREHHSYYNSVADMHKDAMSILIKRYMNGSRDSAPNTAHDATPHSVVVATEKYLSSKGYNNSIGKYDKIVQGVKSLLGQGYLEGKELEGAVAIEAERLLKKYGLAKDSAPKKIYDSFTGMMVEKGQESEFQKTYDSMKSLDEEKYSGKYKVGQIIKVDGHQAKITEVWKDHGQNGISAILKGGAGIDLYEYSNGVLKY